MDVDCKQTFHFCFWLALSSDGLGLDWATLKPSGGKKYDTQDTEGRMILQIFQKILNESKFTVEVGKISSNVR